MGLYQPAKRLQMARQELKHIILRPGELHILIPQLRAIGAFIDNSGLDMCWIESELYGSATVKKIIESNHVKRGEVPTLLPYMHFPLYQEAFFQYHPNSHHCLEQLEKQLADVCIEDNDQMKEVHEKLVQTIDSAQIVEKMEPFDVQRETFLFFKVVRHYMRMVMEMMQFIRAVGTGN